MSHCYKESDWPNAENVKNILVNTLQVQREELELLLFNWEHYPIINYCCFCITNIIINMYLSIPVAVLLELLVYTMDMREL